MASTPNEPTNWTLPEGNCEKCGAPASWAEEWTQNLSWKDSMKLHMAIYFASPRVWPLGYILGSSYSPLRLEQQHPEKNWRDMFEDLLALESGKKMISAVSRQKEAATSYRLLNESVHEDISQVNLALQRNQDFSVLLHKLREISLRIKDTAIISKIDEEALPFQKKGSERSIADGKALIASLTGLQNKPASSHKTRVPWIVSLISSGAMLGWESVVYDSADGWQADVYKTDGSNDGHLFTELDLTMTFNDGFRLDFGTPSWNTYEGSYNNFYPQIEQICPEDADPDAERTYSAINNLPPSILSQSTTVQRKKSWNGSIETRVILKNKFTDGKEEEKTITNDSSKVLEEVSKLDASVKRRHDAVGLALWELSYHKQKEFLASAMEMEDDGVD